MTESGETRTLRVRWLVITAVIIGGIVAAIVFSQSAARAAPEQPIDFSHQTHSEAEVECLFCHPNALRSDIAGIPSVERCVGCHRIIEPEEGEIQKVLGYWERNEPIPWVSVQLQPDHVLFSHQPHLRSGLSCAECHGEVSQMTVIQPVINMDMGWCLNCHQEQPDEKVARLTDCLACHK